MKKLLFFVLTLCLALSLAACAGSGSEGTTGTTEGGTNKGPFMAGFGVADITPKDSVPLDSYGDARSRMSTGRYTKLEARAVVIKDEDGNLLVFATGDVSWCPNKLGKELKGQLSKELSIPENQIILSGTHTHASVATGLTDIPAVVKFNNQYISGMKQAVLDAVADLKPAEVYVGSAMTESMNFVRSYFMDDGSVRGPNYPGTGTTLVSHVSESDKEVQLMKFVREGGKDILISNFQAHPHLEGKTTNISAQTVGAIRDAVEKNLGVHSLHWNGAAGNLNSNSDIKSEVVYTNKDRAKYGEDMSQYIKAVYNDMTKVQTGPITVAETILEAKVNHSYDNVVEQAQKVYDYFKSGHTAQEAQDYAQSLNVGIHSYYHASRIISNSKLPATQEMYLMAWSFGDVAGVVLPYEMYDTSGMQMKQESPFERTFIVGYSYPSYTGYVPDKRGFELGGYEADNCTFQKGTAEDMVEQYLNLLDSMHK